MRSEVPLAPQVASVARTVRAPPSACPIHRYGGSDVSDPTKPPRHGTPNVMAYPCRWLPQRGPGVASLLISAAVLVAVAGCDRDDSTQPTPTRGSPSSTATSRPSPTVVPDPLDQARSDLRKAQSAYYDAYLAAAAAPGNARAVNRLLAVYQEGSPGAKDIKKRMKLLADNGFAARPGPKGYFVVQRIDVSSVADGATAQVETCSYYDGVTYDTKNDGPDGEPITVDDTTESGRTRFRYVNQAGAWKLVGGDVLKTWTGENRCPAK
jgi:hypothetical protein